MGFNLWLYALSCGIRQGAGVLSLYSFALYVDSVRQGDEMNDQLLGKEDHDEGG